MKIKVYLSIFISLISACAIQGDTVFDNKNIYQAEMAINLCMNTYLDITGTEIDEEIDRAYVLKDEEKMDILFSRAESGIFGVEKSIHYMPFIVCGVLGSEKIELYFLEGPINKTLLKKEGGTQITANLNGQDLWYLLYLRDGESFKFIDSKDFYEAEKIVKR